MSFNLTLTKGDYGATVIRNLLNDDGSFYTPPNDAAVTLVVAVTPESVPIISSTMAVTTDSQSNPAVTYVIQQGDTDSTGEFEAWIHVETGSGRQTFPVAGPERWLITDDE